MVEDNESPFGPIISRYTDEDGIRDGQLIRVTELYVENDRVSLITKGVFAKFSENNVLLRKRMQDLINAAEGLIRNRESKHRTDWFYTLNRGQAKYFLAENNTPGKYTLMLPEEY